MFLCYIPIHFISYFRENISYKKWIKFSPMQKLRDRAHFWKTREISKWTQRRCVMCELRDSCYDNCLLVIHIPYSIIIISSVIRGHYPLPVNLYYDKFKISTLDVASVAASISLLVAGALCFWHGWACDCSNTTNLWWTMTLKLARLLTKPKSEPILVKLCN